MDSDAAFLEFLRYAFSILLSRPEEATIRSEHRGPGDVVFHVGLHADDIGKVIGRNGRTVAALRRLLEAGAIRSGVKATLRVEEKSAEMVPGGGQDNEIDGDGV
jgi:predicted RNA-binding protein YlqC (UPF0109 family)